MSNKDVTVLTISYENILTKYKIAEKYIMQTEMDKTTVTGDITIYPSVFGRVSTLKKMRGGTLVA